MNRWAWLPALLAASVARGEWIDVGQAERTVRWSASAKMNDVESRLAPGVKEERYTNALTRAHEMNHAYDYSLANMHRASAAIYVGDGKAFLVRTGRVLRSRLAAAIPLDRRGPCYRLYFRTAARDYYTNREGIYGVIGEWNAYQTSTLVGIELRDRMTKYELAIIREFAHYGSALQIVARNSEVTQMVRWLKERNAEIEKLYAEVFGDGS